MKSLIYVIDSQPGVCELARSCLEAAGYSVETFRDTPAHLGKDIQPPSLVITGMEFEGRTPLAVPANAFEICRSDKVPLIVLLGTDSPEQRLAARSGGADDCMVKPFTTAELLMRVRALLRRSALWEAGNRVEPADLLFDSWAMKVFVRGNEIPTTTLEFRLMEYLAWHRGQVFTRDFLLDAVWGDMRFINPRSVDACIRRIREKIELDRAKPIMLKTIRGVGYRMDAIAIWESAPVAACDCAACKTQAGAPRWNLSGTKQGKASAART